MASWLRRRPGAEEQPPAGVRVGRGRWARLSSLSPRELRDLSRAQLALGLSWVQVRTLPTGRLVDYAVGRASGPGSPAACQRATELALAVERAAEYGLFRPSCLVRSMAILKLLRRSGIARAELRVGVRKREDQLEAHAWVELDGRVLGDRPERVATFTVTRDLNLVR